MANEMPAIDPARLRELELKARARQRQQEQTKEGFVESFGRNVAEPVNRGVVGTIRAPADIVNMGLSAVTKGANFLLGTNAPPPQIPGAEATTRLAEEVGMIAPPEEQRDGIIPRAAEIFGGSFLPVGFMMNRGGQVIRSGIPAAQQTGTQAAAVSTAKSPGTTVAVDAGTSFTSALGGEVAGQLSDDPAVIAIGELAGGFSPSILANSPLSRVAQKTSEKVVENIAPFTEAGAKPRAARRLQDLAGDPENAAEQIGKAPELSPARQTGDPRLIALENRVLADDPKLDLRFSDELQAARTQLRESASFGGDPDRAVQLLEVRARMAAEKASAEINRLGPDATPRQVSAVARQTVDEALTDARATERSLWESLDQTAPAELTNARNTFDAELASRGQFDNPDDVPEFLRKALKSGDIPDDVLTTLSNQGLLDSNGNIPDGVRAALVQNGVLQSTNLTFKDVQTLRSRVLAEIRQERSLPAPNRNRLRILSDVETALLDDLTATNVEGVTEARQYSALLNERFTQGRVGEILGFGRRGNRTIAPEDTLAEIVFGRHSATSVNQFIETSGLARNQVQDFIRVSYLQSVATESSISLAAHKRFVENLRKNGLLDVFPEMEAQLNSVRNAAQGAERLRVDPSQINTPTQRTGQSRAAVYLQGLPGEEMSLLLRSKNPSAAARSVVGHMNGDIEAIKGLRSSFVDTLMKQSMTGRLDGAGNDVISGAKFTKLLREYSSTASALGFTKGDMSRLQDIAKRLRLAEATSGNQQVKAVIEDTPASILDLTARFLGARSGGNLADTTGSSLVMAQAFSKRMRDLLARVTTDRARMLLIEAHQDPQLYKALLTRSTDPIDRQEQAIRALERALLGNAVAGARIIGTATTQDEQ